MALHYKLQLLVWADGLRRKPPMRTLSAPAYRRAFDQSVAAIAPLAKGKATPRLWKTEDRTAHLSHATLPVRVYQPRQTTDALPVLLYFHGGGFVVGTLGQYDHVCARLAHGADCVVVSVDYRLAPEYPFPAAADDAWAAVQWVAAEAASLGGDARRLAVMGDSAGANLAAVAAVRTRDQGGAPLAAQVLIYPVTDNTGSFASRQQFATGYLLTKEAIDWFSEKYIPSTVHPRHPYHSPHWLTDHARLPPALVITAGYDPLRDEGAAYAQQLTAAGNRVRYVDYPAMVHGFFSMPALLPDARRAMDESVNWLRTAFAQ